MFVVTCDGHSLHITDVQFVFGMKEFFFFFVGGGIWSAVYAVIPLLNPIALLLSLSYWLSSVEDLKHTYISGNFFYKVPLQISMKSASIFSKMQCWSFCFLAKYFCISVLMSCVPYFLTVGYRHDCSGEVAAVVAEWQPVVCQIPPGVGGCKAADQVSCSSGKNIQIGRKGENDIRGLVIKVFLGCNSASEADSQGCSIEISIYMSVCLTSKINARTWVIACASFGVLNAWTAFNRSHAPYYCPATNNCKLSLLFTI